MKRHTWKLGDSCFIVDESSARIRIMPAQVIRISGLPEPRASAMALNENRDDFISSGPLSCEGTPFATVRAARTEARNILRQRTSWLAAWFVRIPLVGTRPNWEIPKNFPEIGQVVYILDEEAHEICEVVVGFRGLDMGRFSIGYDASPGNPEANMVRIREWWRTQREASEAASQRHRRIFKFVSKEDGAARVDQDTEKTWNDGAARLRDPEWNRRHNEAVLEMFR